MYLPRSSRELATRVRPPTRDGDEHTESHSAVAFSTISAPSIVTAICRRQLLRPHQILLTTRCISCRPRTWHLILIGSGVRFETARRPREIKQRHKSGAAEDNAERGSGSRLGRHKSIAPTPVMVQFCMYEYCVREEYITWSVERDARAPIVRHDATDRGAALRRYLRLLYWYLYSIISWNFVVNIIGCARYRQNNWRRNPHATERRWSWPASIEHNIDLVSKRRNPISLSAI